MLNDEPVTPPHVRSKNIELMIKILSPNSPEAAFNEVIMNKKNKFCTSILK